MVSIPVDLLDRIDRAAAERNESRSAFLQEAARARLAEPDQNVADAIAWVRGRFDDVEAPAAAELVRRDRDRDRVAGRRPRQQGGTRR